MPRYLVHVTYTLEELIQVTAADPRQAEQMAHELMNPAEATTGDVQMEVVEVVEVAGRWGERNK